MGIKISKDHLHHSVLEFLTSLVGDLNMLETDAKENAVDAINELLTKVTIKKENDELMADVKLLEDEININKQNLSDIITNEGGNVTSDDTISSLITKLVDVYNSSYVKCEFSDGDNILLHSYSDGNYWTNNPSYVTREEYQWTAVANGTFRIFFKASTNADKIAYYKYDIIDKDGTIIKSSADYYNNYNFSGDINVAEYMSKGQKIVMYLRPYDSSAHAKCNSFTIKARINFL